MKKQFSRKPVSPPQHEWQQALSKATSPGDVLEIVSTYLQRLEPWELGELPAACKPRAMDDIADLSGYAYDLKRNAGFAEGTARETLDRITNLMSEAALRL